MSGPFGLEMGMKKDQVKIAEEIAPYTYGLIIFRNLILLSLQLLEE